ncbi:helix-turn-helix domain-containing protein, partial [Lactococcus lactis]
MDDREINKFVGMKIKEFRKNKKLTQQDLADLVGVKNSAISNYEQGTRIPKRDFLFRVANALGVSIDEFFPIQNEETSSILSEINKISSQLEEPRQKIVLNTATNQLDEQNQEKKKESKVIPINKIPDDLPPYISRKILENFTMPTNTMEYEPDEDMVDVPILGRIAA